MIRIEIGRRNYLLYLLLPHRLKSRLLTPASRAKLDRINRAFNETIYSGAGASAYDQIHRYAEDEQHEYPARPLVAEVWPAGGYGRALEVGAGSGYFTTLIARHARSVIALEPVADMQEVLKASCRTAGVDNVELRDPIPRAALLEAYRAADVLLMHLGRLPAFEKVLPSKVFEYAALGKPILAGVAGYAAKFVEQEIVNAAVFPPGDAIAAVAAFGRLTIQDAGRPDFAAKFGRPRIMTAMADDVLRLVRPLPEPGE